MAVRTYRFKLEEPGVTAEQLESDVGVVVDVVGDAGGMLVDIECEEANYSELAAAMYERGFSFVEGDPVTTTKSKFRSLLSLLSLDSHQTVRHLIHFIEEGPFEHGAYKIISPSGPKPTSIIWYNEENPATRKKIVELSITYTGSSPTVEEWEIYDESEVLLATVTDNISYSGPFETDRTRSVVVA